MKKPKLYTGFAFSKGMKKKRKKVFQKQLKKNGFDDTELWNLDGTIMEFLIPRLKRFRKILHGYPSQLTEEKWDKVLKQMIKGFEEYQKDDMLDKTRDQKKIDKAFKLFTEYFVHLWD